MEVELEFNLQRAQQPIIHIPSCDNVTLLPTGRRRQEDVIATTTALDPVPGMPGALYSFFQILTFSVKISKFEKRSTAPQLLGLPQPQNRRFLPRPHRND